MIGVDQIIVGIAKECRPLTRSSPLARRIGMGCELGLYLARRTERSLIQRVEIFADRTRRIYRSDAGRVLLFLRC